MKKYDRDDSECACTDNFANLIIPEIKKKKKKKTHIILRECSPNSRLVGSESDGYG